MQPEHLLQEGLAGPVTGHVHECRKGDEDKGIVAIRSPDLLLEPQVRSLGPFFPPPPDRGIEVSFSRAARRGAVGKRNFFFPFQSKAGYSPGSHQPPFSRSRRQKSAKAG